LARPQKSNFAAAHPVPRRTGESRTPVSKEPRLSSAARIKEKIKADWDILLRKAY
jgi:hypothetical protein